MARTGIVVASSGAVLFAVIACNKTNGDTVSPQGDAASGIEEIGAGTDYTAALFNDGYVRVLGAPLMRQRKEGELPFGDKDKVAALRTGRDHACVLLESGAVKCIGHNPWGALGYGNTEAVRDPEKAAALDLGGKVVDLSAGHGYTCAVLEDGTVRCWGTGQGGRLGYGSRDDVLDAAKTGPVPVGGPVRDIETGSMGVTCAILQTGSVRCWGQAVQGTLGYGSAEDVGASNTPADVGDVQLPGKAVKIAIGAVHVCALLEGGNVRCWGFGVEGRLGYKVDGNIGDDETPMAGKDVDLGGPVSAIAAGDAHTCARLETGAVRCWGQGSEGALGYGDKENVGIKRSPAQAGDVAIGGKAKQIIAGPTHTCALLESGHVMCWGSRIDGKQSSTTPIEISFAK